MLLRLFAPFLPYVTEEVWSWWRYGSVHRQTWPTVEEIRAAGAGDDPAVLPLAAGVLAEIRKAKSTAKLSMRATASRVSVVADAASVALLDGVRTDLVNAGVVEELHLGEGGELRVEVVLAPVPA